MLSAEPAQTRHDKTLQCKWVGGLTMNMDFQPDLTLATRASTIWDTHLPRRTKLVNILYEHVSPDRLRQLRSHVVAGLGIERISSMQTLT